ncbi:MAG: sulfite exporter TauE/SafE family protein [Chloroflexota bacterium]
MDPPGAFLVIAVGIVAGTVNTIVGSGSLLTFPTLLFLGYPPLVANVSNTVGLVPGTISGAIGYRRELAGQGLRARPLLVAAGFGGVTGACLLLILPASAFARIVPILILIACALVAIQPRLSAWVLERRARSGAVHIGGGPLLVVSVYLTGIYGGYFGAAQGVILIALLSILVDDHLQRLNGLKNLITVVINGVAALIFIAVAPVAWPPAILLAIGSIIGGQLGAVVGRRLSPFVLRGAIIVVGTAVALRLLLG